MLSKNLKIKSMLAMLLCATLWSTAGIFIKMIPWNPMSIAGSRSLIAAGVLYLFMRHLKIPFTFDRYSVLGGIFLSGTFIFFVTANKLTTAANAIALQFTAPIFILILSTIFFRQKFRLGDILTVAGTTIGISLFFMDKLSYGNFIGNLVAIIAGLCFASMYVTTGRADENSRMTGLLLGNLLTAVIGVPFMFILPGPITATTVTVTIVMGVIQLGIPYVLYNIASRQCSALACSLIGAVEPLLNPVWVFIFDGEVPGFFAMIGCAVVISCVVIWCIWSNLSVAKSSNQ